jgi:hypothetical protein
MYFLLNDNNLDLNRLGAAKMAHCLADQAGIYLSFLPYFAKNAEKMTLGKDWYKIRLLLPPGFLAGPLNSMSGNHIPQYII